MRTRSLVTMVALVAIGLMALIAHAAPRLINYQGRLADAGGLPINDPAAPMVFSIWDADTLGTKLWEEARSVEVVAGVYSVQLGFSNPIAPSLLGGDTSLYLQVTAFGERLWPRQRLTSAAYALQCDELDGIDSKDFAAAVHEHGGADITSGTIETDHFSAYTDLFNEGYLNNDSEYDLLPQGQSDPRYLNADTTDATSGSLTIGGDLTVSGGNIGLGVPANNAYGILMDPAAAPQWGGQFYGSVEGLRAAYGPDPADHYAILAYQNQFGIYARSGANDETATRLGGAFQSVSQGLSHGVEGIGYGYGAGDAAGVYGYGRNFSSGNAYGGFFLTEPDGSGEHYGVYAQSDDYPGYFANSLDPANHYVQLGDLIRGVVVKSGSTTDVFPRLGGFFMAYSQGGATGISSGGFVNGGDPAYGLFGTASNYQNGEAHGGYFVAWPYGAGGHRGVTALASSNSSSYATGVYGSAQNEGDGPAYGGFFESATAGTGLRYGVYAQSDMYPGAFVNRLDTTDHRVELGAMDVAVRAKTGDTTESGLRTGAMFNSASQNESIGIQVESDSFGGDPAKGVIALARNGRDGFAEGGYFEAMSDGTGWKRGVTAVATANDAINHATGVYGRAENLDLGPSYGGYFEGWGDAGGEHYGVYAVSDDIPGHFAWTGDQVNHYVSLAKDDTGVLVQSGNSLEMSTRWGVYARADGSNYVNGVVGNAYGYGSLHSIGVGGMASNMYSGDAYGGAFGATGDGWGNHYGVSASANSVFGMTGYGVWAQAYGTGTNYGLYVANGTKNWVNPDPEDPDQSIVYATLEGGENGTYWRGTARLEAGVAEVILPEHFRKATSPDFPVTVTVSPLGECNGLFVAEKSNERIVVKELMAGTSDVEFDFIIMGKRLGYEQYEPIIENVDYVPFRNNLARMDETEMTTQEYFDQQSEGMKKIFKQNGVIDKDGKVNEALFQQKGWKLVKEKKAK